LDDSGNWTELRWMVVDDADVLNGQSPSATVHSSTLAFTWTHASTSITRSTIRLTMLAKPRRRMPWQRRMQLKVHPSSSTLRRHVFISWPLCVLQGVPIKNSPLEKCLYVSSGSADLSQTCRCYTQHILHISLKQLYCSTETTV